MSASPDYSTQSFQLQCPHCGIVSDSRSWRQAYRASELESRVALLEAQLPPIRAHIEAILKELDQLATRTP